MLSGKVKWFNNAKGYGFIVADGGDEDLFAHYSAIQMEGYRTLKAGQAVMFNILQGPKGLHATEIRPQQVSAEVTTPTAQAATPVDA
ncbi:Cold shock-like protein CspD OS=Stutzerimonas stutzeri OX=316 GN=cspD PE=4 SV=1 [Stutzerimonas stutzeri]|nr:cold-shock protein CspD [Stutzerimonas stutzeri TS44]